VADERRQRRIPPQRVESGATRASDRILWVGLNGLFQIAYRDSRVSLFWLGNGDPKIGG
jgi:hypothetical protein